MSVFTVGVDVGNYDTKSQHCYIPSSFKRYRTENILDEESVCLDGVYYTPTIERNNQQDDKTNDDYCVIISLFAIAKEILFQIKEGNNLSHDEIQAAITNIDTINLGIGLPVGFLHKYARLTIDKYKACMSNGITFRYRHVNETYTFSFKLDKCVAYAQGFTAVIANHSLSIPMTYEEYYIIDIGGGTIDITPVYKCNPVADKAISLKMGTTFLYTYIINTLQQETGYTMDYSIVEAVLRDKPTIIDEERKNRILALADEFANKIVDEMIHVGCKLSDRPCVFLGGGSLLFKNSLEKNRKISKIEFIDDVNINAKYYAEFARP